MLYNRSFKIVLSLVCNSTHVNSPSYIGKRCKSKVHYQNKNTQFHAKCLLMNIEYLMSDSVLLLMFQSCWLVEHFICVQIQLDNEW